MNILPIELQVFIVKNFCSVLDYSSAASVWPWLKPYLIPTIHRHEKYELWKKSYSFSKQGVLYWINAGAAEWNVCRLSSSGKPIISCNQVSQYVGALGEVHFITVKLKFVSFFLAIDCTRHGSESYFRDVYIYVYDDVSRESLETISYAFDKDKQELIQENSNFVLNSTELRQIMERIECLLVYREEPYSLSAALSFLSGDKKYTI